MSAIPYPTTAELEARCRECQTRRSGEGYGDDVPPKIRFDDMCDHCEVARELRFRMGITQATASGEARALLAQAAGNTAGLAERSSAISTAGGDALAAREGAPAAREEAVE